jgi:protein SCO1
MLMQTKSRRWGMFAAALALLMLGVGAWIFLSDRARDAETPSPAKGLSALGRTADDVVLRDMTGRVVAWGDLKGTPRAVFFGFTSCPEICPTTLADLAAATERVGVKAQRLRIDFVTVDPARDTPEVLRAYLGSFGERVVGYTGDEANVARLAAAYRASYRRVPLEDGDYTMDHTTGVYLIDARGQVRSVAAYQSDPERLDTQLIEVLKE